jgi:hypothetical protein
MLQLLRRLEVIGLERLLGHNPAQVYGVLPDAGPLPPTRRPLIAHSSPILPTFPPTRTIELFLP